MCIAACGSRQGGLPKIHDLRRDTAGKGDYWPESAYMKALNERPSPSSPPSRKRIRVSADRARCSTTLIHLWPYIWPSDRRDLKQRVIGSMVLLLVAKLATIAVPFTFKWATDALAGHGTAPVAASDWLIWAIAAPIAMTIAYGGMRILMAALTQLRDGLFAKVAMHAVRRLAYPHLRAHARTVVALPSGAQDRRADARAGARPQRHRNHRADGDSATVADHRRACADRRRADVAIRLALCRGDPAHRRGLHGLHLSRDRMAHRHPPQDE